MYFDIDEMKRDIAIKKIEKARIKKDPEWFKKMKDEKQAIAERLSREDMMHDDILVEGGRSNF